MNRMGVARGGSNISSLFIFLLIGIFTVFSLLSVVIGVGVYRGVTADASANEQIRTTLSYVANKVRAADSEGGVSVEEWHGVQTLLLREEYEGDPYETRIYFLPDEGGEGGGLYEHFAYQGDDWGLEGGERIISLGDLRLRMDDGLLSLSIRTLEGQDFTLRLRPRVGD